MKVDRPKAIKNLQFYKRPVIEIIHAYTRDDFVQVKKTFDEAIKKSDCAIYFVRENR